MSDRGHRKRKDRPRTRAKKKPMTAEEAMEKKEQIDIWVRSDFKNQADLDAWTEHQKILLEDKKDERFRKKSL